LLLLLQRHRTEVVYAADTEDALAVCTCMALLRRLLQRCLDSTAVAEHKSVSQSAQELAEEILGHEPILARFLPEEPSPIASAVTDGIVSLLRLPGVSMPLAYRAAMVATISRQQHDPQARGRDVAVMLEFCPILTAEAARGLTDALLRLDPLSLATKGGQATPQGALVLGLLTAHETTLVDPPTMARLLAITSATECTAFVALVTMLLDRFAPAPPPLFAWSVSDPGRCGSEDTVEVPETRFCFGGDLYCAVGLDILQNCCRKGCHESLGYLAAALIRGSAEHARLFAQLLST